MICDFQTVITEPTLCIRGIRSHCWKSDVDHPRVSVGIIDRRSGRCWNRLFEEGGTHPQPLPSPTASVQEQISKDHVLLLR